MIVGGIFGVVEIGQAERVSVDVSGVSSEWRMMTTKSTKFDLEQILNRNRLSRNEMTQRKKTGERKAKPEAAGMMDKTKTKIACEILCGEKANAGVVNCQV